MDRVTSQDGTIITFDRLGDGPPVVLVTGGSVDRTSHAPLADILSAKFTVLNYDRRGRGESGDTAPYAIEREIEDLAAVIEAAGGAAFVHGSSSGAALALHAAAAGLSITRLSLWEPPYIVSGRPRPPADTAAVLHDLVAAGRKGDAVEHFMSAVVGLPPEFVAQARNAPFWAATEALAHTLEYDATVMADYAIPLEVAGRVRTATLVLAGGADFPWMPETAQTLARAIPGGQYRHLEGQGHNVDAAALAPALVEFYAA